MLKNPKSNLAEGGNNQQFQRVLEISVITAIDHHFPKNFAPFSTFFKSSGKRKGVDICDITQHFQKRFTDYDSGSQVL